METMKIAGRDYPITGYAVRKSTGDSTPLVGIPMMSDYKWQMMALNDRLENPEKYERYGEDVEATISHLRSWLEEHREAAAV